MWSIARQQGEDGNQTGPVVMVQVPACTELYRDNVV